MKNLLERIIFPLLAIAFATGCKPNASTQTLKPAPPVSVKLVAVKRGDVTRGIVLPADVKAFQQATLYAKVAGYVKTVAVDKGDSAQAGTLLADIEVPELVADLAKYKAEADVAALEFKRINEAQKKAPDLIVAQSVDAAKSKLDVARANLERTQTLLGFAKITAPFSGIVTKRMIDPGAFIPAATSGSAAQNAALFTLMDFSKVRVQVPVPEVEVSFIKAGLRAKISVEQLPGKIFDGTVTRFAHALDDATKTMLAEIELPNPDALLRPGMYASVRLIVETKPNVLVVPSEALFVEKTRTSVFTVSESKAKRVTVKIGFNDAGVAEILEGVKEGDAVVLAGKQTLADGQPVTVTEAK